MINSFKEYDLISKDFSSLTEAFNREFEELEKLHQKGEISSEEFIEKDREVFNKYKHDLNQIKEFIVSHYGEEMYFEFCQKLNWSVHNGEYEWLENVGAIDKSIVHIIRVLNKEGFETKFSCSGIKKEHREDPKVGYIMFINLTKKQINLIKKIAFQNQFYVIMKESNHYDGIKLLRKEEKLIIYNEALNDDEKLSKWESFLNDFLRSDFGFS